MTSQKKKMRENDATSCDVTSGQGPFMSLPVAPPPQILTENLLYTTYTTIF